MLILVTNNLTYSDTINADDQQIPIDDPNTKQQELDKFSSNNTTNVQCTYFPMK